MFANNWYVYHLYPHWHKQITIRAIHCNQVLAIREMQTVSYIGKSNIKENLWKYLHSKEIVKDHFKSFHILNEPAHRPVQSKGPPPSPLPLLPNSKGHTPKIAKLRNYFGISNQNPVLPDIFLFSFRLFSSFYYREDGKMAHGGHFVTYSFVAI